MMEKRENKIVLACDSYKGCLSSREVNEALRANWEKRGMERSAAAEAPEVIALEMSDGGDGMLSAFLSAMGGERIQMRAHDALMRWIDASYGVVEDSHGLLGGVSGKVAIIEIAQTAGLALIEPEQRNPMTATSWGVGEMVMHAYRKGIRRFVVGLGGSATSDCGIGMLKAMGDDWHTVRRDCTFVLASDVTNPLCGPLGAAHVFAPQKGADAAMVDMLDARADRFAQACVKHFGFDRCQQPGAGAAGGLGYAFLQFFDATFHSGADLLLRAMHFEAIISDACLVVTGEGHSDRQTLMGKLPQRILAHVLAKKRGGKPQTWLVSGGVSDRESLLAAGFDRVVNVSPADMPLAEAMRPEVARRLLGAIKL